MHSTLCSILRVCDLPRNQCFRPGTPHVQRGGNVDGGERRGDALERHLVLSVVREEETRLVVALWRAKPPQVVVEDHMVGAPHVLLRLGIAEVRRWSNLGAADAAPTHLHTFGRRVHLRVREVGRHLAHDQVQAHVDVLQDLHLGEPDHEDGRNGQSVMQTRFVARNQWSQECYYQKRCIS